MVDSSFKYIVNHHQPNMVTSKGLWQIQKKNDCVCPKLIPFSVSSPVLTVLEEAFDQVTFSRTSCHGPFARKLKVPSKEIHQYVLQVVVVEPLDSKDLAHLTLLDRTELGITFTKVLPGLPEF